MNFNPNEPIEKRLAQNVDYYHKALKTTDIKTLREWVSTIVNEFLNDTLSKKMNTPIDLLGDRMPLKYKTNMALHYGIIGEDLEYTLLLFDKLTLEIEARRSYTCESVAKTVDALIVLNENEMFHLMVEVVNKRQHTHFLSLKDLLNGFDYQHKIHFLVAVIAASLIEILLVI